ncbi:MAG: EpsG family protein [Dorea sp.]|jgi:hypothetical protein|nr:EpsG family protein [Dorea sp.]MCI9453994.1 EpsG family protein [Dorea sp.]
MSAFQTYTLYIGVFLLTTAMLFLFKHTFKYKLKAGSIDLNFVFRLIFMIISLMPLILMATYRYDTGTDYFSFESTYNWCMRNLDSFSQLQKAVLGFNDEPGMLILLRMGGTIFGSFQGFLFLASILTVVPALIAFIIYDNEHFDFCFLIYLFTLYLSSYNGIHQHIAVSWSLLAVVLAYKEKYLKAVLLILFVMLFHTTAVFTFVFLILILWSKRNIELKLHIVLLISIISIIGMQIILSLLSKMPLLARYEYAFNEHHVFSVNFIIMHMAFKIPLIVVMLLRYKKLIKNDRRTFALLAYTLFDAVFVFSAFYMRWSMRMQYYTLSVSPLLLINIFESYEEENNSNRVFIKSALTITYIVRFFVLFGIYSYDSVIPYTFLGVD